MSELSEGDLVVTPYCRVKEVIREKGDYVRVEGHVDHIRYECLSVNAPIRVRVDEPWEAECLVALAEGNGFEWIGKVTETACNYVANPDEMTINGTPASADLTFESDYQQIKAWIEAHGKLEDDDSSDPRPEDEEWRSEVQERLYADEFQYVDLGLEYGLTQVVDELCAYIDDLESELQDCWENQQEYKNDVGRLLREKAELQEQLEDVREERDELQEKVNQWARATKGKMIVPPSWVDKRERDELKERIEEAREYVERCSKYFNLNPQKRDWEAVAESAYTRFDNLLEILTLKRLED